MTMITPYPIRLNGHAGMLSTEKSPKPEREALLDWCRRNTGGWFTLKKLGDRFAGHQAWVAYWPGGYRTVKFVTCRA